MSGTRQPVKVLEKALDLLWTLAEEPGRLTPLARKAGFNPPTAYRILETMTYRGLIWKAPDTGIYSLGPGAFFLLSRLEDSGAGFSGLTDDALRKLAAETGETATVHVRLGDRRVCVAEAPSPQALRYSAGVGSSAPLHVGAAGKAICAFVPESEQAAILARISFVNTTESGVQNLADLHGEIARIKERGYATSTGERVVGAAAVSVPIRTDSRLVGVLSLLGPESRMPEERVAELAPTMKEVADRLAQDIERAANRQSGVDAKRASEEAAGDREIGE
jgi:DNA-binding IclR family transcriptional regulator